MHYQIISTQIFNGGGGSIPNDLIIIMVPGNENIWIFQLNSLRAVYCDTGKTEIYLQVCYRNTSVHPTEYIVKITIALDIVS